MRGINGVIILEIAQSLKDNVRTDCKMAVNGNNNVNWFDIFIVFVNEGITCCYE